MFQNENGIWLPDKNIVTFVKPTDEMIAQRKYESLQNIAKIKAWGLRNPVKFAEMMFGIEFLDYQAYAFASSWNKSHALWLFTRNGGKSMLLGVYDMTRAMLLDNSRIYILAGTAAQSIDTFSKIEDIAKKQIPSMGGLTDVFGKEIVSNLKNNDGFIHNPAGFKFSLYNGSFVKTLSSNLNALRGKRASLVNFDECAFLPEEVFSVVEPYTAQDSNFISGGGLDPETMPRQMPNQLLYASSASSVDTPFYAKYKEYSKKMFYGDPNYFVCDFDCDLVMKATKYGRGFAPLLTQEKVDTALTEDKERALREYYNRFSVDAGENAIVRRGVIARNSFARPPVLCNDKENSKTFIMAYDPARSADNSVVTIGELFYDEQKGWKLRIVNCANFMDPQKKNQTPLRTPDQVKKLKKLILDYNGKKTPDYANIDMLYIDAGSGGAGRNIGDYLMEDWYEEGHEGEKKYLHRGMIDRENCSEYVKSFPKALDKVRLMEPTKYRSTFFEALQEMTSQDLIEFTSDYDNKGYIRTLNIDERKYEDLKQKISAKYADSDMPEYEKRQKIQEELENEDIGTIDTYKLSVEEEVALTQIDAMKEEAYAIVRIERPNSNKDDFQITAERKNSLHDDRVYTLAMLAYALQEKRRENITKKKRQSVDNLAEILPIHKAKIQSMIG